MGELPKREKLSRNAMPAVCRKVGAVIRGERLRRGWSQEVLAAAAGGNAAPNMKALMEVDGPGV